MNELQDACRMVIADAWMAEAAMEGLDLSLVTDMLMLSATSPWNMYIAERNQVHLNPCSQQCNAMQYPYSSQPSQTKKLYCKMWRPSSVQ